MLEIKSKFEKFHINESACWFLNTTRTSTVHVAHLPHEHSMHAPSTHHVWSGLSYRLHICLLYGLVVVYLVHNQTTKTTKITQSTQIIQITNTSQTNQTIQTTQTTQTIQTTYIT